MSVKGYYFPFKSIAGSDLEKFLPQGVECVLDLDRLPECYAEACAGKARVFLDMPTNVPGIEFGKDTSAGYRRTVVCTDFFGAALPINTIVIQHQAVIREVKTPVKAVLAAARVAGYRHACFGLPAEQSPLLFTAFIALVAIAVSTGYIMYFFYKVFCSVLLDTWKKVKDLTAQEVAVLCSLCSVIVYLGVNPMSVIAIYQSVSSIILDVIQV